MISHPRPPTPPLGSSSSFSSSSHSQPLPVSSDRRPSVTHERRSSVSLSVGPLLINQLKGGAIFLKHGSRGNPHYRYARTSADMKFIHWGDLKSRKIHGSIPCDSLVSVLRGHESPLFHQRAPKNSNPSFCFSIKSTARTLDLECSNEQERDFWAKAFEYLIQAVRERPASISGNSSGANGNSSSLDGADQPSLVEALEILSSNYEANNNNAGGQAHLSQLPVMPVLTEISEDAAPPLNHGRSRSGTISGKIPHQINNLYGWLDDAQAKIERLEKENELYKEDNRKLMISYAKKMIKLQDIIDNLRHENLTINEKSAAATKVKSNNNNNEIGI